MSAMRKGWALLPSPAFLKDYSAVRAASFTQTRLCTGLKKDRLRRG